MPISYKLASLRARFQVILDDGVGLDTIAKSRFTTVEYSAGYRQLVATVITRGCSAWIAPLGSVRVFGVQIAPTAVTLGDGVVPRNQYEWNGTTTELRVFGLSLNMSLDFVMTWTI